MKQRFESDSLGLVAVPRNSLFGAQTARAVINFGPVPPGFALSSRPLLIRSLLQIKKASAQANHELGLLDLHRCRLIVRACDQLLRSTDYSREFPIHLLHGGGGTSANMNANEVVANLANSLVSAVRGIRAPVDALDHVNKSQSTNDVYPSACRLAIALHAGPLLGKLALCAASYKNLKVRFGKVPKVTRTCLQDAIRSDWGRYFDAQVRVLLRHHQRITTTRRAICSLNLGGGIAGEPRSSPARFRTLVMARLAKEIPDLPIRNATQLADAAQNSDDLVAYGQALDGLCRTLIKQAADLRLLSSGPECGFMEIALPPRQPGSSAMPGKVNPVIPEFLMQCCFSVIGYISSCGLAAEHAELDLNVWEGIFLQSMCSSTDLLVPALNAFADYCLRDLTVNRENAARRANNRTSKIAEHAKRVSYSDALKDMESLATQVR